jgi:hypothetical protein
LKVFRGCNPNGVAAVEREGGLANVHFKPGYLKDFKSAKVGPRPGECMIDKAAFEASIKGHYDMVRRAMEDSGSTPGSVPHLASLLDSDPQKEVEGEGEDSGAQENADR